MGRESAYVFRCVRCEVKSQKLRHPWVRPDKTWNEAKKVPPNIKLLFVCSELRRNGWEKKMKFCWRMRMPRVVRSEWRWAQKKGQFTFTSVRLLCILKTPFSPSNITITAPLHPPPQVVPSFDKFPTRHVWHNNSHSDAGRKKRKENDDDCNMLVASHVCLNFILICSHSNLNIQCWCWFRGNMSHGKRQKIDEKQATQWAANWKTFSHPRLGLIS